MGRVTATIVMTANGGFQDPKFCAGWPASGSEAAILIVASIVPAVLEAIQLLGMSRDG